ncbi:MAG: FxsA family protein [bacterium]|nr:FxsA family protein [bacterium]MCP4966954.1 FxsA family protein [bacterium]
MRLRSILFLAFVLVPPIEIGLFIAVGGRIGLWPTMAIVLVTAVIGANLVSLQGRGVLASLQAEFASGQFPAKTLAHGAMILVAGALLVTPGFLTDVIGFSLLTPEVREILRKWGVRRWSNRMTVL